MRAALIAAALVFIALGGRAAERTPLIYSTDSGDSWNRIFAALFTRTISAFETDEYPDARATAPLPDFLPPFLHLRVSTRTFDRDEPGDRATEALYPSFMTGRGPDYVLTGPAFEPLRKALQEALVDGAARTPLDRALMQPDLWSAYDQLDAVLARRSFDAIRKDRASALTPLLAALIRKVALTRAQIAALPDTYAAARRAAGLPDLFAAGGEWMEVRMAPRRMHDDAADMRRASRVFIRPRTRPTDERRFLDSLPDHAGGQLAAAALVMQTLLIDSRGDVVPTRLFSDVQVRTFVRGGKALALQDVDEFELSRRRLRDDRSTAFVHFDASAPAYLAIAGNDYGLATPAHDLRGETAPILSTLRSRCAFCHSPDGNAFMTFNLLSEPGHSLPPIVRLPQPNDDQARTVSAAKAGRADFERLLQSFQAR